MKFLSCIIIACLPAMSLYAQNVGINNKSPVATLDVNGSFKVSSEYIGPVAGPSVTQTVTMINGVILNMRATDSTARVYDPGGPAGNYNPNIYSAYTINLNPEPGSYLEMYIESLHLRRGDSLIIYDGTNSTGAIIYRIGETFIPTATPLRFPYNRGYILFKSNSDLLVGEGFSLLFKRRFSITSMQDPPVISGSGVAFYPVKAAFRAGTMNAGIVGNNSTALGYNNTAAGQFSVAMGFSAQATGYGSLALGFNAIARGDHSTAIGYFTKARSHSSLVIGRYNDTISAESATDAFRLTDRAFVIGDGTADNLRSDCFYIQKNGNVWMQGTLTQASDIRLKKNIVPLQHVLPRLMNLKGYNYYWKDSLTSPGLQAGLIAQEVKKQLPELVTTSNAAGELAVNYNGMLPYLLEGIKEQQQELNRQKEKIKKLEDEMRSIRQMLQLNKKQ